MFVLKIGARLSAALAPGAMRSVLEDNRFDASHQRLNRFERRRGGASVLAGSGDPRAGHIATMLPG